MKSLVSFVLALGFSQALMAAPFTVDTKASQIKWIGKKVLVKSHHTGTLQFKSGNLQVDAGKLTAATFVVDLTSLKVMDITDAEDNAKLTNHLKSDDFFGVAQHPEAKFELTQPATFTSGEPTELVGNFTIKGTTQKDMKIPATITVDATKLSLATHFNVDRTKFNVRFGSKKFFENLVGDRVIADEFEVDANVIAASALKAPETKPQSSTKK